MVTLKYLTTDFIDFNIVRIITLKPATSGCNLRTVCAMCNYIVFVPKFQYGKTYL